MRNSVAIGLALSSFVAAACVESPSEPPLGTTTAAVVPETQDQGKWLLGADLDALAGIDGLHHFAVGTTGRDTANQAVAISVVGDALRAVDATGAVHQGADPWFAGLRLFGPGTTEVQLGAPTIVDGVVTYGLLYRASPTAPWIDLMPGERVAAFAGSFTRAGVHEASPNAVSFAFTSGVAHKCKAWGYGPGSMGGSTAWLAHQACTRMARADVCGDGTSFTREGTQLQNYDVLGVSVAPPEHWPEPSAWPVPHNEFVFESAWTPGGALCLSRMRWKSLAVGPLCGGVFPDPRLTGAARFCDQQTSSDLVTAGALVFNTSHYADIRLETWSLGTDLVATVRGYSTGANLELVGTPPFAGYGYVGGSAVLMRTIPASVAESDVSLVQMFENTTGDHVLGLASSPPVGYTLIADRPSEGYLFLAPRAGTVPLRQYRNPTTGDRTSATAAPAGYVLLGTLGHAVAGP
jgi:hypothetical protein